MGDKTETDLNLMNLQRISNIDIHIKHCHRSDVYQKVSLKNV